MSAPAARRLIQRTTRSAINTSLRPAVHIRKAQWSALRLAHLKPPPIQSRCFSISPSTRAGIMPDTDDPAPPPEEAHANPATQPTEIDEDEYHARADEYMEAAHDKAQELQESREDVEVEYSAGVLSISFPPNGTYVLNKQPPNKQVWLSSPLTGPKRYDWVVTGESMHQKEGSGQGEWIYLRDGSTLTSLLNKELGLLVDPHEVNTEVPSKDATE